LLERPKPNLMVGVRGEVGHGKSTLVSALTRISAAKGLGRFISLEEINRRQHKQRSIVRRGYIPCETALRLYTLLDAPNLSDCLPYGSQLGWDAALLVLDPTKGPIREVQGSLRYLLSGRVQQVLAFFNHPPAQIDGARADALELELRSFLNLYSFAGNETPIVHGSALAVLNGREGSPAWRAAERLLDELDLLPLAAPR
jgi:elongation factor Tu